VPAFRRDSHKIMCVKPENASTDCAILLPSMRTLSYRLFRVKNWLHAHRLVIAALLAVVVMLFGVQGASAQSVGDLVEGAVAPSLNLMVTIVAYFVNIIAYAIGRLIVVIIGMVVIPILGYNNFGDSFIISVGWPIVRDIVNMFVIIVMLILAVRTMISSSSNWGQQLPRLFLAVVMVNFSRTITLFLVDIGQVVMFTFVNSLRDIAAGNFVNLFQLRSFLSLTGFDDAAQNNELADISFEAFGFLATGYVGLMFLFVILGIMLLLAAVFIYRIVIIWVLVILSPLAFFAFGVQTIVPQIGAAWSKWIDMLVGAVVLGPVLVFFLWLGLATAAQGSLATAENFPVGVSEDIPTLYSEVLELDSLLSLFIGMALIMLGFQAASTVAGSFAQQAGGLITADTGKRIVKGVAKAPVSMARRGAREGGRQLAARTDIGNTVGKGLMNFGKSVATSKSLGPLGGAVGRGIVSAGGRVAGWQNASVDAARKSARATVADMGETELLTHLSAWDGKTMPASQSARNLLSEGTLKLGTNSALQKKLKKKLIAEKGEDKGVEEYEQIMVRTLEHINENKDDMIDEKNKKAFFKTKVKHMSTWIDRKDSNNNLKMSVQDRKDYIDGLFSDEDYKDSMMSEANVQNSFIKRFMKTKNSGKVDKNGKPITIAERFEKSGSVEQSVKDAYHGKGQKISKMDATTLTNALKLGHQNLATLQQKDLQTTNSTGQTVTDAARVSRIAEAIVRSGVDWTKMAAPVQAVVKAEMERQATSGTTLSQRERFNEALVRHETKSTEITSRLGLNTNGNWDPSMPKAKVEGEHLVRFMVTQAPTQVRHLDKQISANASNDLSKEVAASIKDSTVPELRRIFDQVKGTPEESRVQKEIAEAATVFVNALSAEASNAQGDRKTAFMKKKREMENVKRYFSP
jgi:hypothetical protein